MTVIKFCRFIIKQKRNLLELVRDQRPGLFSRPMAEFFDSSVAGHIRHSNDHFLKLASTGFAPGANVDYDNRERDLVAEGDIALAFHNLEVIDDSVKSLGESELTRDLTVKFMIDPSGESCSIPSTYSRELAFCSHHATHHLATVRLILETCGIVVDDGAGLANSTQKFRNS